MWSAKITQLAPQVCDPVVDTETDRPFSLPLTIFGLLFDAFAFIRLSLQPRCTLAACITNIDWKNGGMKSRRKNSEP
jgi:hypothetical protein